MLRSTGSCLAPAAGPARSQSGPAGCAALRSLRWGDHIIFVHVMHLCLPSALNQVFLWAEVGLLTASESFMGTFGFCSKRTRRSAWKWRSNRPKTRLKIVRNRSAVGLDVNGPTVALFACRPTATHCPARAQLHCTCCPSDCQSMQIIQASVCVARRRPGPKVYTSSTVGLHRCLLGFVLFNRVYKATWGMDANANG